jgi:hypothetical protein
MSKTGKMVNNFEGMSYVPYRESKLTTILK